MNNLKNSNRNDDETTGAKANDELTVTESFNYFDQIFAGLETDSNPIYDYPENSNQVAVPDQWLVTDFAHVCTPAAITTFLRTHKLSPQAFFCGAFAYTLAKFSGQDESVLCLHPSHDSEPLLPVYIKFDEESLILDYLAGVQANYQETRRHNACSFEKLAGELNVNTDILFVFQADATAPLDLGSTHLAAVISPKGDSFQISLHYRSDLYKKATIQHFADLFKTTLRGFLNRNKLREIPLISEADRQNCELFNRTEVPYDTTLTMVDMLRNQMKKTPEQTALVYQDVRLSYRELDELTDRLAKHLKSLGIGREDIVPILLPKCETMTIASIGVLKAGAAYQPLDPTYPMDRLAFMIKDTAAKLMIADEAMLALVPEFTGPVILTKDIPTLADRELLLEDPRPEDLFVMLYTSGSTGVPKGVMLEHRNVVCFCQWYHRYYELDETARVAAYASFGFDANIMDTYPALTVGGTVHIIADEIRLDLLRLNDYFEANGITNIFMTTQVGRQFAENIDNHSLIHLSAGGEKLADICPPNYQFHNFYGPTETTVGVTSFLLDAEYNNIPIGKAFDNIKLYILDPYRRQVPIGVPGELCIAGMHVGRGYLNRLDATAAAFGKNPYCDTPPYDRIYYSGDIVRYLPDGNIEFVGRRDAQVKIRGFRVELTEIEAVIRQFPGIKDATVVAYDQAVGGKYIVAYIVADSPVDISALNAFIETEKPPYMVPAVTIQIEAIPLNQNLKVNKKALPLPLKKQEAMVAPENDTQQQIYNCIAKILGHDQFGITTDLHDAGLTSIGTLALNVSLSNAFGVVVKTRDLKANNTVVKLEAFLKNAATVIPVTAATKLDAYPVSQTQMALFVESMAKPTELVYHIPFLFKLHDDVDLKRLKTAIEATIEAHAYIKTRFFMDDAGEIMQRRRDEAPVTVRIKDYLEQDKLVTPFKLIDGRLFNGALYQTKDGNYFFIDIHHMICDGTSLAILVEDINRAYAGETLAPERYSSFEAALEEQQNRASADYAKAQAYYAGIFEGCDSHFLPGPDKSDETQRLGKISIVPEALDVAAVTAYCQIQNITPNAFFVGLFGYVLGRYNHKKHSVFTTIYNGRNDSRTARSLGMFVKTLPIYCNLDGSVAELLTATKNQLMDSMDHDLYSFAEISRAFGISPDILLAYQGDDFEFDTLAGLPCECLEVMNEGVIAPISVAITIRDGGYHFSSAFRADLYEDSSINALLTNLALAARQVLSGADLTEITLLFDEAQEMINDPRFYGQTFVDLFCAAAAKYPDHLAVKDKNGSITYAQLDAASDALAVQLLAAGVKKEDFVGVLSGRTREFIIGVVAAMKAGGAYVPLDPEYPEDRLRYMMEDSDADILLYVDEYQELTRFYQKQTINLDAITASIPRQPDKSWVAAKPSPDDLAYMIYTSGSTGKPKGVMISHGNLSNMILNETLDRKLDEKTKYGQYASFCFDASVLGIFPALANGSSLYLFAEEDRKDAVKVCQLLKDEAINAVVIPTQMGEIIIDHLSDDSSLTHFIVGGEKLKRYYERSYDVINVYGPTECTVVSTTFKVDQPYKNIPIGKSYVNMRSYIVDENLNPVPVGIPGELCHAGRQVGRGYHNLPEKTAAAFVPNPFATGADDQLLYRTGDMARRRGDGLIEYIGRIDSQVKIRGYRIELSEIEVAMIAHPGIKETAVSVLEQAGNKYIVGYYTRPEGELDPKVWHHLLLSQLPEYMIPTFYVHLDKMPVTPGGKTNKKALPKPETGLKTAAYLAPESDLEKQLVAIFAATLGLETVSVLDDFFAIGGTSISATKVAMKCMTQQIPLAYADIFEYKTVKQLAEFIEKRVAETIDPEDVIKNFDYQKLGPVLLENDVKNLNVIKKDALGDIILTGATGFLGTHILREFLDHYDGKVTCFIRKGKTRSLEQRIKTMLVYYFDRDFEELFGTRIFCVEGDITNKDSVASLTTVEADTIINCAACVKHFVADDTLEKINVRGVENLIELCQQTGQQLIQISTVSIAGEGINGAPPRDKRIKENEFYFEQSLENAYVHSKFLAERAVLAAVAEHGLQGKIMRVGNLMSRNSDGEFQINFLHNGFMRGLKGYKILEKFPVSVMNQPVEFSPIDTTAHAILKLAETNPNFTVFHPYNNHTVYMADVLQEMNAYGFDIAVVSDEEFEAALKAGMADPEIAPAISGLIVYLTSDTANTIYPIDPNNQFTTEVLYRIGHSWPITNETYMHKSIKALDGLGFFDIDEN